MEDVTDMAMDMDTTDIIPMTKKQTEAGPIKKKINIAAAYIKNAKEVDRLL